MTYESPPRPCWQCTDAGPPVRRRGCPTCGAHLCDTCADRGCPRCTATLDEGPVGFGPLTLPDFIRTVASADEMLAELDAWYVEEMRSAFAHVQHDLYGQYEHVHDVIFRWHPSPHPRRADSRPPPRERGE